MPARVGIVVRTVDRPEFLARALADIGAQQYDDWEVVVVNDGGDPVSVAAVAASSTIADRVSVVDSRAPGGRCAAANTGVEALASEFVVIHDDDDLWDAAFLSRTVAWLDEHPADTGVGVATAILYEKRQGDRWVEASRTPFWADLDALRFIDLLDVNRAVPISLLYRRAVHDKVGPYDETLEAVEDWEFYLRVLAVGTLGFIGGAPLAMWTQRPGVAGPNGNSMFVLEHLHDRDDLAVRDRELKAWVATNGIGLPLYLADLERRLRDEIRREINDGFERQRADVRHDIDAHQPVWSRLRRLRARTSARLRRTK
ncbi:glycosyltransferase involved in cell wall biosynthesis [Microbacterium trichothecenolyticum]|uniref:glycosyltransferase family 2 protein n=1 Tax=Microbacterium trichothecenolyticum TaxID=69370 RepID=UPI00286224AC|nr:glycosyltransferase family A protein [Microbacterium trichothecenolyticum]MDR7112493.1 glycosyltransferase involved in cell wall biosynthesis [Microbacterium trichothecenolyticum]